jgi:pyruvate,water dikinase
LQGNGFRERITRWFWAALAKAFILKLTRRFLDLREDLRFLLDKSLYQIRLYLLKLGTQLGLGELALFLDISELRQMVKGRMSLVDARQISSKRLESFLKSTDIPAFYVDGQPVEVFDCDGGIIYGIGTSPGRVTGRARIVENPAKTNIQQGDIVVARNTDPGWTPILSSVGGMVMEEGGLLNHCSIVSRELGVPSIVGVSHATQTIPDGSLITIDGGLGVIQIEE